jgi:hypothetical protein
MFLTFIFIGFAWYRTFKGSRKPGKWNLRMLYGTTVLSVVLVIFTIIYR